MSSRNEIDKVLPGQYQQQRGGGVGVRTGARVALTGGLLLASSVALGSVPSAGTKTTVDPMAGPSADALNKALAILERSGVAAATGQDVDQQVAGWNNWSNWQNY